MKAFTFHRLAVLAAAIVLAALLAPTAAPAAAASSNHDSPQLSAPEQFGCSYEARYVADVTIPDNSFLKPGSPFTKVWRIRNTGSCAWGSGGYPLHSLVFVGGTQLANSGGVPLPPRVLPGEVIDISIPMVAPNQAGTYRSEWKLQLANGSVVGFGSSGQASLYVQIIVPSVGMPPPGICSYYTVRYGDWLYLIALRFGVTWQAIAQANGLANPNWIYAGMRLAIPCRYAPPPGDVRTFKSTLYDFTVRAPAGWSITVHPSVPSGGGSDSEYVTFSSPTGGLPQIEVHVRTGAPPFTGFENCNRNLIFRGYSACSIEQPAGQQPAQRLLIFQRGDAHFHIALSFENNSGLAEFDSFMQSWQFTN